MNKLTVNPPPKSHAIVGDYVINVDLASISGPIGTFYQVLKSYGFDTNSDIIPGASDGVVSVESQKGGLGLASSLFNHFHTAATTKEVLNKNVKSFSFGNGFPVGRYP